MALWRSLLSFFLIKSFFFVLIFLGYYQLVRRTEKLLHCILICLVVSGSLWPRGLYQAPLSMGSTRQEYWSGLPFPSPGDLPHPEMDPGFLALEGRFFITEPSGKPMFLYIGLYFIDFFPEQNKTVRISDSEFCDATLAVLWCVPTTIKFPCRPVLTRMTH